jgi:hypothetical protein
VLGAVSRTNAQFPVPLELREALRLSEERPTNARVTRAATFRDYASGLRSLPVPAQLSLDEAAALFEVWMKDRALYGGACGVCVRQAPAEADGPRSDRGREDGRGRVVPRKVHRVEREPAQLRPAWPARVARVDYRRLRRSCLYSIRFRNSCSVMLLPLDLPNAGTFGQDGQRSVKARSSSCAADCSFTDFLVFYRSWTSAQPRSVRIGRRRPPRRGRVLAPGANC